MILSIGHADILIALLKFLTLMIDLCFVCSKSLFEEEKNLSITTNGDSSRHMTTVQIV